MIKQQVMSIEALTGEDLARQLITAIALEHIMLSHSSASWCAQIPAHCIVTAHSIPEESLAQPTLLLAFYAEGFALQCYSVFSPTWFNRCGLERSSLGQQCSHEPTITSMLHGGHYAHSGPCGEK